MTKKDYTLIAESLGHILAIVEMSEPQTIHNVYENTQRDNQIWEEINELIDQLSRENTRFSPTQFIEALVKHQWIERDKLGATHRKT